MLPATVLSVEHAMRFWICAAPAPKRLLDAMHSKATVPTETWKRMTAAGACDDDRSQVQAAEPTPLVTIPCDARAFHQYIAGRISFGMIASSVMFRAQVMALFAKPILWCKWHVKDGTSLHLLQVVHLKRGIELLK